MRGEAPSFSEDLTAADSIPCLNSDQASSWTFQTPDVLQVDSKIVDFELSCPEIEDIFIVDFNGESATLTLDTSGD